MVEILIKCPVCKGLEIEKLFNCKDYVASEETFEINKCITCELKFTSPRPSESQIGKYYNSDKYISHAGNDKSELGLTYKLYDIIRNITIKQKISLIKKYHKHGNLLDLGCGLGHFLHAVSIDRTYEVTGADISDEAINFVKYIFNLEVINEQKLNSYPNNSFDIITQWHVLEHVFKLEERMQILFNLLKDNGTMFIAVPNSNSFDSNYYKEFWDGYDVPRHLYHFTTRSFQTLMNQNGFKVIAKKPMLFDAPYISMRSEYHQKNKFGFIRGALVGTLSNIFALKTKNYSSILYIVKKA